MKPLFYYEVREWIGEEWQPCPRVAFSFNVRDLESKLLTYAANTAPLQFNERTIIVSRLNDGMMYVRSEGHEYRIFEVKTEQGEVPTLEKRP